MGCLMLSASNQVEPMRTTKKIKTLHELLNRQEEQEPNYLKKFHVNPDFDDLKMLGEVLSDHPLLYKIPRNQRTHLIACFDAYQCPEGATVFTKGSIGDQFFIIRSGTVQIDVESDGKQRESKKILGRGSYFGDLALIYQAPRSATVRTLAHSTFYCLSNDIFRRAVQNMSRKNYTISKEFILNLPLFRFLTKREKNVLAYNTILLRYDKDASIFEKGDDASSFFIVAKGSVELRVNGKNPLVMGVGDSFGQNSFEPDQVRSGSAIAMQDCELISISKESLKKCLGRHLKQISFNNILRWGLSRNDIFKKASAADRQRLIASCKYRAVKDREIICFEGDIAKFVVIVLEEKINQAQAGTIFNTDYLLPCSENDQIMTQRLIKVGQGYIGLIEFDSIFKIFGYNLSELDKDLYITRNTLKQINRKRTQYMGNLSLCNFMLRNQISEGRFENIYEIEDNLHKIYFLKCYKKKQILASRLQNALIAEKQILQSLNSPFISRLYRTFNQDRFIFFLSNEIHGIDFYDLLKQIGVCSKNKAQFYMANIILILEHLHDNNIIFRDLKPQNIIVDESGYLNLVNFKLAKKLTEETGFRTYTVAGTPHYMPPQMIGIQGYTFSADLWSLGVLFYEIVCGVLPFGNQLTDPYEIFKEINEKQVQFPYSYDDQSGRQLLSRLICKDCHERTVLDYTFIKNMKYFGQIQWQKLSNRLEQTPFKLKSKKQKKVINQPFLKFLRRQQAPQESSASCEDYPWDSFF